MAKNKAVSWYLAGSKKPFAHSSISASDNIKLLHKQYGDMNEVFKQAIYGNIFVPKEELDIIRVYVNNGEYMPNLG